MLPNYLRTLDSSRICGPSSRFLCSCIVLDRILVVSPGCSLDTHPLGSLSRRVFGEQRGGAAEIFSRIIQVHGNLLGPHILEWD